ncbi:MAG: sugar ABC transporter substrate-binding protein [Actinobacteria bacterium]|nr:sugar ABC transporter substrate-binding protein [Actinomycetota bacterium]
MSEKQPERRLIGRHGAVVVVAISLIAAILVSGCGSSSDSGSAEGSVSKSDLAKYEGELTPLLKGTSTKPVGGPVETTPGKNVWLISVGQSSQASVTTTKKMEEIGAALGWNINLFDSKFETSRELTGIQQAVAAGADGIILVYFDCTPVRAGLEEAKAAGVAIVGLESRDCSPELENNVLYKDGMGFEEWGEGDGASSAKWLIAETGGETKAIVTEETDTVATTAIVAGLRKQFAKCPTCEILTTIKFTGPTFNQLQGKIEQALNQYPQANAFFSNYDAVATVGGGAAALRASGRLGEIKVAGGEVTPAGAALIRNEEGLDASVGVNLSWLGWESMTLMARIFAGQNPEDSNSGIGYQLVDKEHNLPPKGEEFQPPIDFEAAYEEILGLK